MKITINLNDIKNGIEVIFENKPESLIINQLKQNGFRWSGKQKLWYAKQNEDRIAFAKSLNDGELLDIKTRSQSVTNTNYNLWELTRTDEIEDNYGKYHIHSTKEIAAIIRKHLRTRFPMCKWSITSDYNSIYINLLASPFCAESDEIKAIIHYAYKFAESYNYDNSDVMTDYFDVNFYGVYESSILSYHYEQKEMTDQDKIISEVFQQNKKDFEKAEEIRKQKEFEVRMKQMEIEEAERKKAEEIRKNNKCVIENNHTTKEVDYTILNALLKANKDDNLDNTSYYDENPHREHCQISREVHFNSEVYALFERQLLADFSFLEKMGGNKTDDRRVQSMEDYHQMSKQEKETVEWYCANCVAIFCDGELKLVIDPQGYNYARYVYITDEQSQKVGNYHSSYGISEEQYQHNNKLAEIIEDISTNIIISNDIVNTWEDEDYPVYKNAMKEWIYNNGFEFNAGVIRCINIEKLKIVLYGLLDEINSLLEQWSRVNWKKEHEITIVQINDIGGLDISRVILKDYSVGKYAQYNKAIKIVCETQDKLSLYYKWLYRDVIIYNGWVEVPEIVLFDIEDKEYFTIKHSKYLSCDTKQYDVVLDYFEKQGLKPIINTYKPETRETI